jgi:DNA-directed RNA polymerase subunit RPC12/RpoP
VRAIEGTDEVQEAGIPADAGSFVCVDCSFPLSLDHSEELPECPGCGGTRFRRASMFEQPTLQHAALSVQTEEPRGWLDDARTAIAAPGRYLAAWVQGSPRVFELGEGWSRVGRSSACDIRLDDPTVSRRHAVVVQTPEGELSALDDRSTNGIAVNGEVVDWAPLSDGDEIEVGRYTLHVIETAGLGRGH